MLTLKEIRQATKEIKASKPVTFGRPRERELIKLLAKADPEIARQRDAEIAHGRRLSRYQMFAMRARARVAEGGFMRGSALSDLSQTIELCPDVARDGAERAWAVAYMAARRELSARRAAGETFPRVEFPSYPETETV